MKKHVFLLTVGAFALAAPAIAQTASAPADRTASVEAQGATVANKKPEKEVFSTGVAKGRDILDSAISTSSIRESEIEKLSARSLGEIFHNIPGVRSETVYGETNASITVRGLPLASTGAKFLQLQEDGLPVVEFGDIVNGTADQFLRADLNIAAIEAIRGGSASTFASNSPGGVINLISKTGDVEGGSIQASSGVNYEEYRTDFDYGAHISDTLRFHIGGFYRRGEGPRRVGYDGNKGGQIKFNVTKQFTGGYLRLYGKYLNDRTPLYLYEPVRITGTNADPTFTDIANFKANRDTLLSRYKGRDFALDGNNSVYQDNLHDGQHSVVKSGGVEGQIELAGFTVTERFRYSDIYGSFKGVFPAIVAPAASLATLLGGPGARLSYAVGPQAGQAITDPAGLNGNGLLAATVTSRIKINSFDNLTNDLRASRVWRLGDGDLTTTAGFYKSRQTTSTDFFYTSNVSDIVGHGRSALVNITTATGIPLSQDGNYTYDDTFFGKRGRRSSDVHYNTNAAFGSVNYHIGRIAIGGSLRYDFGNAKGTIYGAQLAGGNGSVIRDINGNGAISVPETSVSILTRDISSPVDYHYDYLSYSTGINFRIAEPLAVFARYSRGARANSDRLLFSSVIDRTDGSLLQPDAVVDYVRQAEAGVKFRRQGLTLNVTGFYAQTVEHNAYFGPVINRTYRAYGAEFEGSYRYGPFSITAGATVTKSEIVKDRINPTIDGNQPAGQPKLFLEAVPSLEFGQFSIGTNIYALTRRYAQDDELLKMPGFAVVSPFAQLRPIERLTLMVNVNNVFDVKGVSNVGDASVPASGYGIVQTINGRTISAAARFDF